MNAWVVHTVMFQKRSVICFIQKKKLEVIKIKAAEDGIVSWCFNRGVFRSRCNVPQFRSLDRFATTNNDADATD